ncbi:MAG: hypothetical protein V4654_08835 [Bdellovibrionota bacterium]
MNLKKFLEKVSSHGFEKIEAELNFSSQIYIFSAHGYKDAYFIGKIGHSKRSGEYYIAKVGSWKSGLEITWISDVVLTEEETEVDLENILEMERKVREWALKRKQWDDDTSDWQFIKLDSKIWDGSLKDRPNFYINDDQEHELIERLNILLGKIARCNKNLYLHQGKMSVLTDHSGELKMEVLCKDKLLTYLASNISWFKLNNKNESTKSNVTDRIAKHFYCTPPSLVPSLKEIKNLPFFGNDYKLNSDDGFYKDEQILLKSEFNLPSNFSEISMDEESIHESINFLLGLLHDFPFATLADKLNYISTWFHPIVRNLYIGPSPLFFIDGSRPDTGKTLLADISWIIQAGTKPQALILPLREEEQSKQITSGFMRGQKIFYFDNLKSTKLDSSVLAKVSTQDTWLERKLGTNELFECLNDACWIFTVNNLSATTEIVRRSPRIRLESKLDPKNRRSIQSFKYPELKAYVIENRHQILTAIYILVQNWINKGTPLPKHLRYLPSFESWSNLFGGIYQCAGLTDFLVGQDEYSRESDENEDHINELLSIWWREFKNKPIRASDLLQVSEINSLLTTVLNPRSNSGFLSEVGSLLKELKGQVRNPYQILLDKDKGAKVGRFYKIELIPKAEGGGGGGGSSQSELNNQNELKF